MELHAPAHRLLIFVISNLQSFRGTSRHAPVDVFSFLLLFVVDYFVSALLSESRRRSQYQQLHLGKILPSSKTWWFQKPFNSILLASNDVCLRPFGVWVIMTSHDRELSITKTNSTKIGPPTHSCFSFFRFAFGFWRTLMFKNGQRSTTLSRPVVFWSTPFAKYK